MGERRLDAAGGLSPGRGQRGKRALAAIADLKRIYGMDFDVHAARQFRETGAGADGDATDEPATSA